jgi:hypothetical protein
MEEDSRSPKRGAFPSPKEVLDSATPYEPTFDQSNQPNPQYQSAEGSGSSDAEIGEETVSDIRGDMGTPGTPPPPSSAGQQGDPGETPSTEGMGTPGTPPRPSSENATDSQSGDGSTKGTPGTPPPPAKAEGSGQQVNEGDMGTPGTPPPPSS